MFGSVTFINFHHALLLHHLGFRLCSDRLHLHRLNLSGFCMNCIHLRLYSCLLRLKLGLHLRLQLLLLQLERF